ncbi:unnamed protein product, partial [Heterosigma akashiwo]
RGRAGPGAAAAPGPPGARLGAGVQPGGARGEPVHHAAAGRWRRAHAARRQVVGRASTPQDHTGAVFGGFAEGAWRRSGDRYYGEAGTFVFRLLPGGAGAQGFHWRGKNRYFMLCNQEGLALGGGGHFALFLDPDFYHGSSGACTTFESP